MKKAIYPGSFDPMTFGHLDIIERSSKIFDEVVIGILNNSAKKSLFSVEERVEMLEELTSEFGNVTVQSFDGLLVDFVKMTGSDVIVRGLRTSQDFEYELPLAQTNYKLSDGTDTIFLATSPEHSYISSSAVKELLRYNADISDMVPAQVYKRLT